MNLIMACNLAHVLVILCSTLCVGRGVTEEGAVSTERCRSFTHQHTQM